MQLADFESQLHLILAEHEIALRSLMRDASFHVSGKDKSNIVGNFGATHSCQYEAEQQPELVHKSCGVTPLLTNDDAPVNYSKQSLVVDGDKGVVPIESMIFTEVENFEIGTEPSVQRQGPAAEVSDTTQPMKQYPGSEVSDTGRVSQTTYLFPASTKKNPRLHERKQQISQGGKPL